MTRQRATELIESIERTCRWTLRGGNDPEDDGNVRQAVEELAEVLVEVLVELSKQDER